MIGWKYAIHGALFLAVMAVAAYQAYNIRLYALIVRKPTQFCVVFYFIFPFLLLTCFLLGFLQDYGLVIHEFDPWFNFRATKYLADNGIYEFFHWFDHTSWYPPPCPQFFFALYDDTFPLGPYAKKKLFLGCD